MSSEAMAQDESGAAERIQVDRSTDGRRRRRQRNVDAVYAVILEMLESSTTPSLGEVARRSGLTVRSIYRYHDDLDAAVVSAVERCRAEVVARWGESEPIPTAGGFTERLATIVERRVELERWERPLRGREPDAEWLQQLDAEVRVTFEPELSAMPLATVMLASDAACHLLRPRSIRSMSESAGEVDRTTQTLTYALRRVLMTDATDPVGRRN